MGERANSDYSSVKEAGETEHGIQCCNKALTEHARKLRQFRWLRIETSRGSKRSICSVPSMPGRAQPPPSLLPPSPPRQTSRPAISFPHCSGEGSSSSFIPLPLLQAAKRANKPGIAEHVVCSRERGDPVLCEQTTGVLWKNHLSDIVGKIIKCLYRYSYMDTLVSSANCLLCFSPFAANTALNEINSRARIY